MFQVENIHSQSHNREQFSVFAKFYIYCIICLSQRVIAKITFNCRTSQWKILLLINSSVSSPSSNQGPLGYTITCIQILNVLQTRIVFHVVSKCFILTLYSNRVVAIHKSNVNATTNLRTTLMYIQLKSVVHLDEVKVTPDTEPGLFQRVIHN